MDLLTRRLAQLDSEIAAATSELASEHQAWLSAGDAQANSDQQLIWKQLLKTVQLLLEGRRALEAKLPSPGAALSTPWNDAGRCSELSRFVKAVPAQGVAILELKSGSVITLEDGVWLGMHDVASADLYVRPCYPELFEARMAYIAERKWKKGCMTVFTGTPGVGKSHLAALFVARAILNGFEVLLECSDGPGDSPRDFYWLPISGDVEHTTDFMAAHKRMRLSNKPVIYVSHGCPPGISRNLWPGHSVTFCSPQRALWRPARKGSNVLYFYVPVLSLEELISMGAALPQYKVLKENSIREWYSWAGGSARTCLKMNLYEHHGLADWKYNISNSLAKATTNDLLTMIRYGGLETFVEESGRIFHWLFAAELPETGPSSPKDGHLRRYTRRCVRFASDNIRNLALMTLDLSKLADIAMACLDGSRSSTGYWVELLAVRCLQMGEAKLAAAILPDQGKERIRFELSVPTASVERWSSPQEAAQLCKSDMSVLCVPHSKTEAAIDAISSPCVYWQITKRERHDLVRSALTQMNTATARVDGNRKAQLHALQQRITWLDAPPPLSKPLLCFLVPPRRFDTMYKSKQLYTEHGKASKAQSEVVHQCVVRLPLEHILRQCSNKVAVEEFRHLVEELDAEDCAKAMEWPPP